MSENIIKKKKCHVDTSRFNNPLTQVKIQWREVCWANNFPDLSIFANDTDSALCCSTIIYRYRIRSIIKKKVHKFSVHFSVQSRSVTGTKEIPPSLKILRSEKSLL